MSAKIFRALICLLLLSQALCAQTTDLRIFIDTAVDEKNVVIHYLDGIDVHLVNDRIKDRALILREPLYGHLAKIQVTQRHGDNSFVLHINDKPAVINIIHSDSSLAYSHNENVINFYDTLTNPLYSKLREVTIKEWSSIKNLWDRHSDQLTKDDSIKNLHSDRIKMLFSKVHPLLSDNASNYFSFIYFTDHVGYATTFIKDDPAYFSELLSYLNATFPSEFRSTEEGQALAQSLQVRINPIGLNKDAPDFTATSTEGDQLTLNNFKGKYVLLDFWATWCVPCLKQTPALKNLRSALSTDILEMISISSDKDSVIFEQIVREKEMVWTHVLDKKKDLSRLYGIEAFPTIVLIDQTGKIVYRKVGGELNIDALTAIINDK
ncbi:TlpA family protein disulfide reductase [Sphingobacterium alkalisoli]|nr:TlpA disulfide reductase family protein [Sphingobacterium alkalisoli]